MLARVWPSADLSLSHFVPSKFQYRCIPCDRYIADISGTKDTLTTTTLKLCRSSGGRSRDTRRRPGFVGFMVSKLRWNRFLRIFHFCTLSVISSLLRINLRIIWGMDNGHASGPFSQTLSHPIATLIYPPPFPETLIIYLCGAPCGHLRRWTAVGCSGRTDLTGAKKQWPLTETFVLLFSCFRLLCFLLFLPILHLFICCSYLIVSIFASVV
jgi:hypothetical protein